MSNENLAKEIYDACHLEGNFLLRSGAISKEYFDKYLFESQPGLLMKIAKALIPLIPQKPKS